MDNLRSNNFCLKFIFIYLCNQTVVLWIMLIPIVKNSSWNNIIKKNIQLAQVDNVNIYLLFIILWMTIQYWKVNVNNKWLKMFQKNFRILYIYKSDFF